MSVWPLHHSKCHGTRRECLGNEGRGGYEDEAPRRPSCRRVQAVDAIAASPSDRRALIPDCHSVPKKASQWTRSTYCTHVISTYTVYSINVDVDRFSQSPVGEVVPITIFARDRKIEYYAFVPTPLPDRLDLSDETRLAVSIADQALGKLEGLASQLPNPHLLVRPIIRREAVSTSALEGTYAALSEVLEAELVETPRTRVQVREVVNYLNATEEALSRLEREPIHINMLLDLHAILFSGVRGHSPETGQVRTIPVLIGPPGATPEESHFVPPPPERVMELLADWERWNYRDDVIPIVVRTAVSHYQFEAIHPFGDGNGRLGRMVAALLLIDRGPLSGHLFSLSPYLESRRAEYGERLREVSATGDWDGWVTFFAQAVAAQADGARLRAESLLAWRDQTISGLRESGLKGLVISIAESLIGYPGITPTSAAKQFSVTYRAANRAIGILEERGILTEMTGRDYGRFFLCQEVVAIFEQAAQGE